MSTKDERSGSGRRRGPRRPVRLPNIAPTGGGDFMAPAPPGAHPANNDPFEGLPDRCSFETEQGAVCLIARETDALKRERLGQGAYGTVDHYCARTSRGKNFHMAIKKIKILIGGRDARHTNELTMRDRTVALKTRDCQFTVEYYETMVFQGEIWIVMELMDTSLDKFYPVAHAIFQKAKDTSDTMDIGDVAIPEDFVKLLVHSLIEALHYLKKLGVIHRDVKPSNILISRKGLLKLCDFGISGELSNSIVSSKVGCQPYMAPERVQQKPQDMSMSRIGLTTDGELISQERTDRPGYGIKSDVWSLGITITEVINGGYPYGEHVKRNAFNLISAIVKQEAPSIIKPERYTPELTDFVRSTLYKDVNMRKNYNELSKHAFYPRSGPAPDGNLPFNTMPNQGVIRVFFTNVFAHLDEVQQRTGQLEAMQE